MEEEKRKLEEREELEEIRLARDIRALEDEVRDDALRIETNAWRKFEEIDNRLDQVEEGDSELKIRKIYDYRIKRELPRARAQ